MCLRFNKLRYRLLLPVILACAFSFSAHAYSVLTHEALVDANWEHNILPVLKKYYPNATEEELKNARAYTYGGAVAPDMGYYPFGSKLFTNLVHYVRSGDFVEALFNEQQNLNELAFSMGVLCHYMADIYGHPLGTNRSVPIVYPKTRKFGSVVTYVQDKKAHLRVEFGFDVLQTARGDYASADYHKYIGFNVADTLMGRAFLKTYGLDIHDIFPNFSRALGTFRWTVKNFFPEITRAAWVTKKREIKKAHPGTTSRHFIYRMHRKQYNHEFGKARQHAGIFANFLSVLIRILPKVGPLAPLKFKVPDHQAELMFVQSFDSAVYHYKEAVSGDRLPAHLLADIDYDTGHDTEPGEYPLCDESYKELVLKLDKKDFVTADMPLRENILRFYSDTIAVSHAGKDWKEISDALERMKNAGLQHVQLSP